MQPGSHGCCRDPSTYVITWTAKCGSTTSTKEQRDVRTSRSLLTDLLQTPALRCWPALRSAGSMPRASLLCKRTFVTVLPLCSEKAGSGQQNKGRSLRNRGEGAPVLWIWGWAPVWRRLGKHEEGAQSALNPHRRAQAALSVGSH